jgi:hypothetical protein
LKIGKKRTSEVGTSAGLKLPTKKVEKCEGKRLCFGYPGPF